MRCNYRYCNKEITYGRPDRRFCNKNCKSKEKAIKKELKSLNMKALKTKDFIEKSSKVHNNKFNYDLVVYVNCRSKVKIICPTHGEFEQTPANHLHNKQGCEQCSRDAHKLNSLTEERLNRIKNLHNDRYQYNDLLVKNGFINIYCPDHGTFSQYLYFHEYGHGCSQCNSSSRGENMIKSFLEKRNIEFSRNHRFDDCKRKKKLRFDFYLPEKNMIIEYDGEHHFIENKYFGKGNLKYISENDEIKNKYCVDNGIQIIRIPYWDYDEIEKILEKAL